MGSTNKYNWQNINAHSLLKVAIQQRQTELGDLLEQSVNESDMVFVADYLQEWNTLVSVKEEIFIQEWSAEVRERQGQCLIDLLTAVENIEQVGFPSQPKQYMKILAMLRVVKEESLNFCSNEEIGPFKPKQEQIDQSVEVAATIAPTSKKMCRLVRKSTPKGTPTVTPNTSRRGSLSLQMEDISVLSGMDKENSDVDSPQKSILTRNFNQEMSKTRRDESSLLLDGESSVSILTSFGRPNFAVGEIESAAALPITKQKQHTPLQQTGLFIASPIQQALMKKFNQKSNEGSTSPPQSNFNKAESMESGRRSMAVESYNSIFSKDI